MHAYRNLVASTNQWNNTVPGGGISGDAYKNSYTYDANGNIKTLNRAGVNGAYFDQLNYKYDERPTTGGATKLESNKLYTVIDPATPLTTAATQPIEDIKTMTAFVPYDAANPATFKNNNFYYDEIGNLIQDKSSHITNIEWNAYGKIRKITMENQYSDLAFEYDASGNRTAKIEQKKDQSTFIVLAPTEWKYTYYVHDAKGNIMSVYEKNPTLVVGGAANDLIQTQVPIYGSSRIGLYDPEVDLTTTTTVSSTFARRFLKQKQYELTNHLGNVLTTISDRKLKNSSGTIAYSAEIISAQDYYPFGMIMPGRTFNPTDYRYGQGGQEKVDEISGVGNHYTAEFWEYDSRTIRRWNTDPVVKEWESPYASFRGNPIWFVDHNGDDSSTHTDEDGKGIAVKDDGDLGVYKHDGKGTDALKSFDANYSSSNTSAGGTKMGETVTPLGFADFGAYEKDGTVKPGLGAKIDFNSNWATEQVSGILGTNPTAAGYALKARGGQEWDIKTNNIGFPLKEA